MLCRNLHVDNLIGYGYINSELVLTCKTAKSEERGG